MDAYWLAGPQLLRQKDSEYDDKALRLAQTIANVTLACQIYRCTLLKTGSATDLDPFLHKFDNGWTFWSVENFNDTSSGQTQGIYLKKSVSIDDSSDADYGIRTPLTEESRVLLVANA